MSNTHVGIYVVSFVLFSINQTQFLSKTAGKLYNNQNPRKFLFLFSTRCIQRDKQIQRRQETRFYKIWQLKFQVKNQNQTFLSPRKCCQIFINLLSCRKIDPFSSRVTFYMTSICTNHSPQILFHCSLMKLSNISVLFRLGWFPYCLPEHLQGPCRQFRPS